MSVLDPRAAKPRRDYRRQMWRPVREPLPSYRWIAAWNLVWFAIAFATILALAVLA